MILWILAAVLVVVLAWTARIAGKRARDWRNRYRDMRAELNRENAHLQKRIIQLQAERDTIAMEARFWVADAADRALRLVDERTQENVELRLAAQVLWNLHAKRIADTTAKPAIRRKPRAAVTA